MRTRRTRIACALALILGVVAACGLAAGPVAPASATTWNRDNDYLHFPPWRPEFRECQRYRELKLNGRYRWFACRYHVAGKGYRIESDITNLATGGRIFLEHAWYGGRYGDGRYEWGSSLDRVGRFRG